MSDSSRNEESFEKIITSKFTEYEIGKICGIASGTDLTKAELETIFIESKDIEDALIMMISILSNRRRKRF